MSALPRPYSRPSRISAANGSLLHGWPSTGTTSVCADSTMPPSTPPSAAGKLASRFALVPSAFSTSVDSIPTPFSSSTTWSINCRLLSRLVVSIEISRTTSFNAASVGRRDTVRLLVVVVVRVIIPRRCYPAANIPVRGVNSLIGCHTNAVTRVAVTTLG